MKKENEGRVFAKDLSQMIDASVLKRDASYEDIHSLIGACKKYGFVSAFSWPPYMGFLCYALKETKTKVGGVVSFPSGQEPTEIKTAQTRYALNMGAQEIDMVMNLGWLKSKKYGDVILDIQLVKKACNRTPLKVIIEAPMLLREQIVDACKCAVDGGADFVKSGSGFCAEPTTVSHIELMKKTVGEQAGLKAAGGVQDLNTVIRMYERGVDRFGIGLESAVKIMEEARGIPEGIDPGKTA